MRGGAGDDSISVTALDFAQVDGGTGRDTLVLAGRGRCLTRAGRRGAGAQTLTVDSVEVVDLSGTGADRLALDALAVFDVTEERDGGLATSDVRGDADDNGWAEGFIFDSTETETGTTYGVYRDGNAQVRVQDGVVVTFAPVFTSSRHASVAKTGRGERGLYRGGGRSGWRHADLQPVRDGCGPVHDRPGLGRGALQRGARTLRIRPMLAWTMSMTSP